METVQLTLDAVFHETIWRNEVQLMQYDQLYNLPRLQYIQHTCAQTLAYTEKKNGFVILLLYTKDGKVYATNDGTTRGLPWGSINCWEDIQGSIEKLSKRIHPLLEIRDVQPMCFIDNTFCHKSSAHTHNGIVFAARVRDQELLEDTQQWWLFHVNDDFIEWVKRYWNKDILTYFKTNFLWRIMQYSSDDMQDEEIETNVAMQHRYIIHRKRGKPLLRLLRMNNNQKIKNWIADQCVNAQKIIDVSCGDDTMVHQLAKDHEKLIVANDISRSQVQLLKTSYVNILSTNHNASHLPFKDKIFDIAICKNTLHHMPHRLNLLSMLYSMKRIAKKIILVEIENPNETWWVAKFIHKHRYRSFLKDVWWAYFDNKQFIHLVHHVFSKTHKIEHWIFTTWQWRYFRATIEML